MKRDSGAAAAAAARRQGVAMWHTLRRRPGAHPGHIYQLSASEDSGAGARFVGDKASGGPNRLERQSSVWRLTEVYSRQRHTIQEAPWDGAAYSPTWRVARPQPGPIGTARTCKALLTTRSEECEGRLASRGPGDPNARCCGCFAPAGGRRQMPLLLHELTRIGCPLRMQAETVC